MSTEKVVVIIPTYNEAEAIEETIHQVFASTDNNPDFETYVLIFDSASTDATAAIVEQLQMTYPNLVLQSEPEKTGLGSAYLQAMHYALNDMNADVVVEFDADLSHQPKYLNGMLEKIKTCDVVLGSRYIKGGSIPDDWGWKRKLLSVAGNYVARFCLTQKYKDFTSGFRATRRYMLFKSLPSAFISNAYAYKVELLWRLHKNKANIVEYPIDFIDRKQGRSKLPANSIVDTLNVLMTLRLQKYKTYLRMCVVGFLGLCVQLAIYNVLRRYDLSPFYASQIAVACAIMNNYLLNNLITFKHPESWNFYHKLRSVGLFIGFSITMIFCQSSWLLLIMKYTGHGFWQENLAICSGIILGSLLNYFVYSRVVWQHHKPARSED
jgi:dolichol-phosphate mannosyltransferase